MNDIAEPVLSEKLTMLARSPKYRGAIFQIEADEKGLALVDGKEASLKIYLMIDPDTDQILETRFFTYGGPVFTALADSFCTVIQGKKISDISNVLVDDLEKSLRDNPDTPSMPSDTPEKKLLAALITKLVDAYPEKKLIAIAARETMEKIQYRTQSAEGRAEADNEWNSFTDEQRLQKINECLHDNIRSTLQMDGGDLEVLGITNRNHVQVRFQGACAGCSASSGGTLFYIEDQLRNNVYYNLVVEPEEMFPGYDASLMEN
jgi:NifU-like protein